MSAVRPVIRIRTVLFDLRIIIMKMSIVHSQWLENSGICKFAAAIDRLQILLFLPAW